jgi:hypothetical protein
MYNGYNGDPTFRFGENNPFLEMLAVVEEDQHGQQPPVNPVVNPQQQNVMEHGAGRVKLPDFWPHAPGIWFARAELRFEVSGVTAERHKFAYTVDALRGVEFSGGPGGGAAGGQAVHAAKGEASDCSSADSHGESHQADGATWPGR